MPVGQMVSAILWIFYSALDKEAVEPRECERKDERLCSFLANSSHSVYYSRVATFTSTWRFSTALCLYRQCFAAQVKARAPGLCGLCWFCSGVREWSFLAWVWVGSVCPSHFVWLHKFAWTTLTGFTHTGCSLSKYTSLPLKHWP